jgi:hypothetical protein
LPAVDGVDVAEDEEIGWFGGAEVAAGEKNDQADESGKPDAHGTWGGSLRRCTTGLVFFTGRRSAGLLTVIPAPPCSK